jgi:pilus assembly protein FimV
LPAEELPAVVLSGVTPATIPAAGRAADGPGTVPGGQVQAGFTTVTADVPLPGAVALPPAVALPAAVAFAEAAVALPAVALAAAATGSITLTAAAGAPGAAGAGAAAAGAGAAGAGATWRFLRTAGNTPPAGLERAGIAGMMTGAA